MVSKPAAKASYEGLYSERSVDTVIMDMHWWILSRRAPRRFPPSRHRLGSLRKASNAWDQRWRAVMYFILSAAVDRLDVSCGPCTSDDIEGYIFPPLVPESPVGYMKERNMLSWMLFRQFRASNREANFAGGLW